MSTIEIHEAEEWSAVYEDGKLVRVGDSYLADEWVRSRFGVVTVQDDAFLRGQTSREGVAQTILRDTAPSGLDVETLARAMAEVWPISFRGEFASDNPSRSLLTDYAERIATEYARLRESADQERTEG